MGRDHFLVGIMLVAVLLIFGPEQLILCVDGIENTPKEYIVSTEYRMPLNLLVNFTDRAFSFISLEP